MGTLDNQKLRAEFNRLFGLLSESLDYIVVSDERGNIDEDAADFRNRANIALNEQTSAPANTAIEITPEMIRAGIAVWEEYGGDEYPKGSLANEKIVSLIFRAMAAVR